MTFNGGSLKVSTAGWKKFKLTGYFSLPASDRNKKGNGLMAFSIFMFDVLKMKLLSTSKYDQALCAVAFLCNLLLT